MSSNTRMLADMLYGVIPINSPPSLTFDTTAGDSDLTDLDDIEHAILNLEGNVLPGAATDGSTKLCGMYVVLLKLIIGRRTSTRILTAPRKRFASELDDDEDTSQLKRLKATKHADEPPKQIPIGINHMSELPPEIFRLVATLLPPQSLKYLAQVCRAFYAAIDATFIRSYAKEYFPKHYNGAIEAFDALERYKDEYVIPSVDSDDDDHCDVCGQIHRIAMYVPMGEHSLDPRKPENTKEWFYKQLRQFCYECGKHTYNKHIQTGRTVCYQCQAVKSEYKLIGVTKAKKDYLMTESDLSTLKSSTAENPLFWNAAPQRLYSLAQVKELAEKKYGDEFDAKRRAKQEETESRRLARVKMEKKRRRELLNALHEKGLELQRGKSSTCHKYIKKGKPSINSIIEQRMKEHVLSQHTNYQQLMNLTATDLSQRLSGVPVSEMSSTRSAHTAAMEARALQLLEQTEKEYGLQPDGDFIGEVTVHDEYDGPNKGDLTLEPGQCITGVKKTDDEDVYFGMNRDGDEGLFPRDCVKIEKRSQSAIEVKVVGGDGNETVEHAVLCGCGRYRLAKAIPLTPCKLVHCCTDRQMSLSPRR